MEGFSSIANKCIEFYMAQFDEGCAGIEKFLYGICQTLISSEDYHSLVFGFFLAELQCLTLATAQNK